MIGDLSTLAETVVLLLLLVFVSTNVAVLALRRDHVEHPHLPGLDGGARPGVASCVLLLTQQRGTVWLFAGILLGVGAVLYVGARTVGRRGRRSDASDPDRST